jgi:hypothetical protein
MAISDWLCCFCGDEIEERAPDPCRISVTTSEDKPQWWMCHAKCFKDRVAKEFIFEPAHF